MSVLHRFPRWLRVVLLGLNLAASLAVLVHWWLQVWPNLEASWVLGAAAAAIALPAGAWLGRKLDQRQEHIAARAAEHAAQHMTEHHETTRAQVREQFAAHAAAQNDRLAVITDQIAALHARLDQQGGGAA